MYISLLFFFNDTATTEIYTLSLHDALPISLRLRRLLHGSAGAHDAARSARRGRGGVHRCARRSEEHTSELQSRLHLVCRLLLEKKKKNKEDVSLVISPVVCITGRLAEHLER